MASLINGAPTVGVQGQVSKGPLVKTVAVADEVKRLEFWKQQMTDLFPELADKVFIIHAGVESLGFGKDGWAEMVRFAYVLLL